MPGLIASTFAVAPEIAASYEVIIVNDGSRDDTSALLAGMQARYGPALRVVDHGENRGYGAAVRSGLEAARYDFVFYTDGDGQYDVNELRLLAQAMRNGVGLVNGYKLQRSDPWHRICIGWLYNTFARALFGIRLRDIDCDFRLMRREILSELRLQSNTGGICVELVRGIELSGCDVVEVGVHHYPRLYGRSQFFRVRSLFKTASQLAGLYWRLVLLPPIRRFRAAWLWAR